jgi:glycosyltransferase involved in cell wall biosynthesis
MSEMLLKVAVSHPTGNANVRAVIEGMEENAMLAQFLTCIATPKNAGYLNLLPGGAKAELLRRSFNIDQNLITNFPLREMARLVVSKLGFKMLADGENSALGINTVYNEFDKKVAAKLRQLNGLQAVYTYEDGALNTFRKARELSISCIYDLPIGYWKASRRLMQAEFENRPEWAATLTGFKDSDAKLARKDEELKLADHIYVASSFTKSTLSDYSGNLAPVSVVPYGFPAPYLERKYEGAKNRPLRLLFVGGLSQRKGIANMLEAVEPFENSVSLTIIGKKVVEDCKPLNKALVKHRYIASLPHHEILREMRQHDVLLFPSLFEGFGLVVTEAMSQGTPVIATERTCGPDLIEHGKNGWIVEAGNTEALKSQIEGIIGHSKILEYAGKNALKTAGERPWEKYGAELCASLKELPLSNKEKEGIH